jgi:hypothetical protein
MDSLDEELPAELVRLRNDISCELYAQLLIRDDSIGQADVPGAAYAVAVRLLRNFDIRWAPVWAATEAAAGEDDGIGPDAATFRGSALSDARFPVFDWEAGRGAGT